MGQVSVGVGVQGVGGPGQISVLGSAEQQQWQCSVFCLSSQSAVDSSGSSGCYCAATRISTLDTPSVWELLELSCYL